jgi:hypothetical protein
MFAFVKALISLTAQLKRIADSLLAIERLYRLELSSRSPAIIELDPALVNERTEVLYGSDPLENPEE